ncbi:unnamed protein product [Discula destructiva]
MTKDENIQQETEKGLEHATTNTEPREDGHHEPSYTNIRSQFSPQSRLSGSESERGQRPISRGEVEKPQVHEDEDDESTSEDSSSSACEEGRAGRPQGTGSRLGLKATRSISMVRDGIESRHEVEMGGPLEKEPTPAHLAGDNNLVTWETDDPGNPKTWSFGRKWAAVFIVSVFTFISPVSSTMSAPALDAIGADLNMTSDFEKSLSLSIFVLAYAVGPLVLGPLSELYGRVIVLQLANLFFLIFNLACGFSRSSGQLIAFRILAGFGGSAPLGIGGGLLSDLFTAEDRGRAMSVYSLAPLLGPAVGPIAGAFIAENVSWRWVFYSTTILDALIQIAGLFFLRETYAPVLLRWRKNKLIKETGNTALYTDFDDPDKTVRATLTTALVRPFRMLLTQPIIQILALYMMYLYGLIYLVLSAFPVLWRSYGFSTGIGGLHYISLGVGFFLGAQVCAPLQDRIYARLKQRYGVAVGRPEFRVPMMVPGAVLMPVGLVVYGWTAQYRTHWIGPDMGATIFSLSTVISFQCIQGYLVDTYSRYAASAVAAATLLRSLAGFGFPLFAPALYSALDYGWGNTMLAFLGVAIGFPGPVLLWKYGPALRARSTFAAGP